MYADTSEATAVLLPCSGKTAGSNLNEQRDTNQSRVVAAAIAIDPSQTCQTSSYEIIQHH
jgi:hypothetical protein